MSGSSKCGITFIENPQYAKSLGSDFILRSLYIFQNLILFKNGKSLTTSWMLSGETLERVNTFSTSMQLSPAIVERALSIVRSV